METFQPYFEYNYRFLQSLQIKARSEYNPNNHPICSFYWQKIQKGTYPPDEATTLIKGYIEQIENEMNNIVSKQSIAYWKHLSRAIKPKTMGEDIRGYTLIQCRDLLDVTINKYGKPSFCDKIALSKSVPPYLILNGQLVNKAYGLEFQQIKREPEQIVFTKINENDIVNYYLLCKLIYEIWRCSSALRSFGHGAELFVTHDKNRMYWILRSNELEYLSKNFDQRSEFYKGVSSATGTVFMLPNDTTNSDIFVPYINFLDQQVPHEFTKNIFGIYLKEYRPNSFFDLTSIEDNRRTHLPYFSAFYTKYGFSADSIYMIIQALLMHLFLNMVAGKNFYIFKSTLNNGYIGPLTKEDILGVCNRYKIEFIEEWGINEENEKSINLELGFDFLTLNNRRESFDLMRDGLHYFTFFKIDKEKYIIDFVWIQRIFYYLFHGIKIDQENFKGQLLENSLGKTKCLPSNGVCYNKFGENRQIDYANSIGNILIIVECKATSESVAMNTGDAKSIKFRKEKVLDKSLNQVDSAAKWLAKFPIGTNYDITPYDYILPIGVTPFKEYIPSLEKKYWIKKGLPRVLSPSELHVFLNDSNTAISDLYNLVLINKNHQEL